MFDIKLHLIIDRLTKFVIFLLALDVISLCTFTITCKSFVPTLSYTSTFRVHDTVFVLIACIQSFAIFLTFLAFHFTKDTKSSVDDKLYLGALEIGIIVFTCSVSLIDESSGIDFKEIGKFHKFFTINLCYFALLWVASALSSLKSTRKTLDQEFQLLVSWALMLIECILVLICMAQWTFAVSIYSNWFLNSYMEGVFEWLAILVAVRLPYHISRVCDCDLKVFKEENLQG